MIERNFNLSYDQLQLCALRFYEWFTESEGYGSREERFWGAVDYRDASESYKFVKTAWRLGFEAGFQCAQNPEKTWTIP
jgi:hypothetical protein